MLRTLLFIFLLTLAGHASAQGDLWGDLAAGPHRIGFRVEHLQDLSRPPLREQAGWPDAARRGRQMQVGIWYPASGGGRAMGYWDYARLRGLRLSRGAPDAEIEERMLASLTEFMLAADATRLRAARTTPLPMRAMMGARPARGRFSLIVMIHNLDHYALYAELLASHGYVVVAVPPTGSFELPFDYQSIAGVETEVRDAEFAVSRVAALPYVDPARQAAFGHSYGAQSAAAYALRNPNVRAIVSLDGGLGSGFGSGLLVQMPYYSVRAMDRPILHLWTRREQGATLTPFDAWRHADRTMIEYPAARHIDFTLAGLLDARIGGLSAASLGETQGDVGAMQRDMARRTLAFLDAYLQGRPAAHRDMAPNADAIHRPGLPLPPTIAELASAHASGGAEALLQRRAQAVTSDPAAIDHDTYVQVWLRLNQRGDHRAALAWSEAFIADHTAAAVARQVRGRSRAALGDRVAALADYRVALTMVAGDPNIPDAAKDSYREAIARRMAEVPAR